MASGVEERFVKHTCRITFDASQSGKCGASLNSIIPKGINCLNSLQQICIRWTTRRHAYHTDVQQMYNAIQLDPKHWRYQLYLWNEHLKENNKPRWKVIKTLIYGVRPSGNLAVCWIRRTAELGRNEFPDVHDVIIHDTYVDDCLSGSDSYEQTLRITDELHVALKRGGLP